MTRRRSSDGERRGGRVRRGQMSDDFVDALLGQGGVLAELVGFESAAPASPSARRARRSSRPRGREPGTRARLRAAARDDPRGRLPALRQPRLVRPEDPELALLLGDQLYALGLSRLAALGDLAAVAELADVISLVAQAQADGDAELAEAVWEAGAAAVGWGPSERWPGPRRSPRAHDPSAAAELRTAAQARRRTTSDARLKPACNLSIERFVTLVSSVRTRRPPTRPPALASRYAVRRRSL